MRDGVWTRGEDTELEAWIGKASRVVVVTPDAIEHYLRADGQGAGALSAGERRRFVRDNISLVVAAANRKVEASDEQIDPVTLTGGEL